MKGNGMLAASLLLLCVGVAYADPCDDRRLTCAGAFAESTRSCNGNAQCVEKAHHAYLSCLAVNDCNY